MKKEKLWIKCDKEMKYSVCSIYVLNSLQSTFNDIQVVYTKMKWNKPDGDIENTGI